MYWYHNYMYHNNIVDNNELEFGKVVLILFKFTHTKQKTFEYAIITETATFKNLKRAFWSMMLMLCVDAEKEMK